MDKLFRLAEIWHCLGLKARLPPPPPTQMHTHTLFSLFFLHLKRESVIALITTFRLVYQTPAARERERRREERRGGKIGLVFLQLQIM